MEEAAEQEAASGAAASVSAVFAEEAKEEAAAPESPEPRVRQQSSAASPVSASSPLAPNAPWWGFKAFDHKVDGKKRGVRVECIEGGPATKAGLRDGDVVVSVDGDIVKSRRRFVEV